MQQGGFLDARSRHPFGMGAVIAAHAVVLTAIILSPPEFIRTTVFTPIIGYDVPDPTPPPPNEEKPKPERNLKEDHVTQQRTIVQTQQTDVPTIKIATVDPGTSIQIKEIPITPPPPVPDPVFVQAQPNMGADSMQPPYPAALARAEIEGKAEIRILIGTDGRVKQVDQVSATDPGFFEATRQQALRHWRFKPATRDGVPVESWRTMTVRFQLQA